MHRTPVSIIPRLAQITFAILALHLGNTSYRQGCKRRQMLTDSITCMACMVLLYQDPPRQMWAFCLALGHACVESPTWILQIFLRPAEPRRLSPESARSRSPRRRVHSLLGRHMPSRRPALQPSKLQELSAAHGRVRPDSVPPLPKTFVRRSRLANPSSHENRSRINAG